jgi:hypothetical protein
MRIPLLGLALSLGAGAAASLATQSADEAAVRRALEHYFQAHATGDGSHARLAFYPQANLYWSRGDSLNTRTSEAYAAGFSGKPADDEGARKRRIVSVDVSGTAAIAKIELDYPTTRFIDYMSLLKIKGEWRIIAKIFDAAPRS